MEADSEPMSHFQWNFLATIVHGIQMVTVVAKSYLIDGAGFMDPFLKKDVGKI